MDKIVDLITRANSAVNNVVWGMPVLVLIIATGVYLTVRLGFFQLAHAKLVNNSTFKSIFKKKGASEAEGKKTLSQFQALTTALAATVGTGNIVGVTTAVVAGGPGAVFWMWISAFFGMMTKFSEIVLGLYYRKKDEEGAYMGGVMYFLEEGLKQKPVVGFLGRPLALLFAVFCMFASFGIGNMSQVNSISESIFASFGVPALISGIVIAGVAALVILGGIKRIGQVCEKLVPFMALFYIACALAIVAVNFRMIPFAFASIFANAFRFEAVAGAAAGLLMKQAVTWGLKRGVFSNEAGLGSSVMAHSASAEREPVKQGMWGIFEVFTDTIVICSLTALVVLTTSFSLSANGLPVMDRAAMIEAAQSSQQIALYEGGEKDGQVQLINMTPLELEQAGENGQSVASYSNVMKYYTDKNGDVVIEQLTGAALMSLAFENALGSWAGKALSVAIILFAFSTVIGWSCYGVTAVEYLFKNKAASIIYKLLFVAAIVAGATIKLSLAWDISDTLNGLMAIPNLIGLLILSPVVIKVTKNYIDRNVKCKAAAPMLSAYDENNN